MATTSNDGGAEQARRPTLVAIGEDEVIRCEDRDFSGFRFFYGFEDGQLARYHEENQYRPDTAILRGQAELVISNTWSAIVPRSELDEARTETIEG